MLQIPTALATNFGMLLAFRFLTGFFGSPALAIEGASITDMYAPRKQAYGLGERVDLDGLGDHVALRLLSGLLVLLPSRDELTQYPLPTHALYAGDERLICEPEIMAEQMTGKDIAMMMLVKPFTLDFTEPMIFLLNLYIAFIYGLIYIWLESFPIVFVEMYGFSLGEEGLAFLGLLVAALITLTCLFAWFYYQEKQFDQTGHIAPEKRLIPAMVGCIFVPIPSASSGLAGALAPASTGSYQLSDRASSPVFAGNDLSRSAFGTRFPLFASAMYRNLGVAWASSTLAFLGIAFIPIPYVLFLYGKRLRMMSKRAREDI
ncbi:Caffeine resistance protein 5 [Lachnellula arida]|uniref:Caffeine resistance protein 5 n=1 Tax=Lachnellula arida TaxID=1316785 RepID=A0A8T9B362_9HELO|nr:Caffeine resistance protein 5 [Lachnellula arida]